MDCRRAIATAARRPTPDGERLTSTALAGRGERPGGSRPSEYGRFFALHAATGQRRRAGRAKDPFEITEVLDGFDPQLAEVEFSFKVECGPDFDCEPAPPTARRICPTPPPINYLAKDYGIFRTHHARPDEPAAARRGARTSEADIGVALAELIAYVGDQLSYQQDAVATEAYLDTARSRISLRRHARLVDYHVHDGCNARAWIRSRSRLPRSSSTGTARASTPTRPGCRRRSRRPGNEQAALARGRGRLRADAGRAALSRAQPDSLLHLGRCGLLPAARRDRGHAARHVSATCSLGDVLIFQEVIGPQTGDPADADLRHRCAVRLTAVRQRRCDAAAARRSAVRGGHRRSDHFGRADTDAGDRDPVVAGTRCRSRSASPRRSSTTGDRAVVDRRQRRASATWCSPTTG